MIDRLPLLAVGGGTLVLTALAYALGRLSYVLVLAALGVGALLVLLLYARQRARMTIRLSYKGNMDDETESRFSGVSEALEGLASSEEIWSLPTSSKRQKAGEVLPTPERKPAKVGLLPTPGIKTDTRVWGIEAGGGTLFFFPEGMLFYRNDRYEPVSYDALMMALSSGRYFEESELSSDATVVETVWRYSRPDGSPDPRYKNDNFEIPVVLYNLLDIRGPSGLKMRLMVSNRREAVRFAKVFHAKDLREKMRKNAGTSDESASNASSKGRNGHKERTRSPEEIESEARLAAARKTLGVEEDATPEQIGAAYRELARTHHPDKVASLEPKARDYSEQRMKEINVAYAELRGKHGTIARGARPA